MMYLLELVVPSQIYGKAHVVPGSGPLAMPAQKIVTGCGSSNVDVVIKSFVPSNVATFFPALPSTVYAGLLAAVV
jgi:hypothetical protein